MNLFSIREQEIFDTLKQLKECDFVVIGGYAVNAYTLPRFSVDCDIVVYKEELYSIEKILVKFGYKKMDEWNDNQYSGKFARFEKNLGNGIMVSVDVLIEEVTDRMTKAKFECEWIFRHSGKRALQGKTISEKLELNIINIDALLVMKIISCRATDIRDVFMMLPNAENIAWIKAEVSSRYNFNDRVLKIMEKATSKQFKDGLSGVYGYFEDNVFEKHKKAVLSLREEPRRL